MSARRIKYFKRTFAPPAKEFYTTTNCHENHFIVKSLLQNLMYCLKQQKECITKYSIFHFYWILYHHSYPSIAPLTEPDTLPTEKIKLSIESKNVYNYLQYSMIL